MTAKEVGEILRVHPLTVVRLLRRGKLKGKKVNPAKGGHERWEIEEADLKDYLKNFNQNE